MTMAKTKRAALYLRVSTGEQSIENQRRELQAAAEVCGWQVVADYEDAGISGSRGSVRSRAIGPCSDGNPLGNRRRGQEQNGCGALGAVQRPFRKRSERT